MRAVVFEADGALLEVRTSDVQETAQASIVAGADQLLAILNRLGVKIAVLASNDLAIQLETHPVRRHLHAVVISEARSIDPEKRGLTHALTQLQAEPEHTVVVSSRVLDMLTAKEGNFKKKIGVSYGNGNREALKAAGADHIINDIPSLLDVLE